LTADGYSGVFSYLVLMVIARSIVVILFRAHRLSH